MQKRETNKRIVRKKTGERISGKIHNVFPQETASISQSCGSVILIIHHLSEACFAVSSGPHFCQCQVLVWDSSLSGESQWPFQEPRLSQRMKHNCLSRKKILWFFFSRFLKGPLKLQTNDTCIL